MKPLYVRCHDRTVFPIDRNTLEALACSHYDPLCFKDPDPNKDYISHTEWVRLRNQQWDQQEKQYYRDRSKLSN